MNGHAPTATGGAVTLPQMPAADGPPVVSIQNVSFSGSQLRWIFSTIMVLVSGLVGGGYLFIPAKQDDLRTLERAFELVRIESQQNRDAIGKLTEAVTDIKQVVVEMRDRPPPVPEVIYRTAPAPRARSRPPVPASKPLTAPGP